LTPVVPVQILEWFLEPVERNLNHSLDTSIIVGQSKYGVDDGISRACDEPPDNVDIIRIITLALGARLPSVSDFTEYVEAGGLMSYGPNFPDLFRRAAGYVDKILRGAKPGDIPVEQPTKFDLVINLITAKALGLDVSPTLLARTDKVIE
jgi:hypothetical protein